VSSGLTGPNSGQSCARTADPPISVTKSQGGPNPPGKGSCAANQCSYVIANLSGFPAGSTVSVSAAFDNGSCADNYAVPAKNVLIGSDGTAQANTGCWAGNTNVGIIVNGTTYDYGFVSWRRF
jgi:hypothetical protein